MQIDRQQVEHIANLSRLSLTEDEKTRFGSQLSNIFGHIEKLNELDTTGIEPTSHVLDISNVVRADIPSPSLPTEEALINAPDRNEKSYRVPKIIE